MIRRTVFTALLLSSLAGLMALPPAAASEAPTFDGPEVVAAAPDFATERFADPWDYANIDDILVDPNGPTIGAANTRVENGRLVFDAVSNGYVSPLFPGYPEALVMGREGGHAPIDANRYTRASLHLYAERDVPGALMWFAGCREFTNDCLGGHRLTLRAGWNTYDLPLVNEFPGLPQAWSGAVFGLRLAFNPSSPTRVELDWLRVYRPSGDVQVSWTHPGGGGSATLLWERDAAPGAHRTSGVVAQLSGSGGTTNFPASAYPPGTYRFVVEAGGTRSAPSEPLRIARPPMPVVLAPDEAGGEDWATAHTGRGWDFTHASDATEIGNAQNVVWSGGRLSATNGPPVQNDPYVVLRQPAPIDPSRYHRLTVRASYEGPFDLEEAVGGGSHGRLLWRRADTGDTWTDSHEIVTYMHVHTYTVSLQTDPPHAIAEVGPGWTGSQITAVRWDPNEDRGQRRWHVDEVALRADHETSGGVFDIRWVDRGYSPNSTVTLAHHRGSSSAPGVTIASGVPQQSGENVHRWNAGGLPADRYWISVTVNDGLTSARTVSSGPVRVQAGGAPPPPPPDTSASCPTGHVPGSGFVDVAAGSVHRATIDCVVWWELAQGVAADRYAPDRSVTRAQMATFIARLIEATGMQLEAGSTAFTDIAGHTHEQSIRKLAAARVVAGTTATTYSPDLSVTRAQMATFLVRAYREATGEQLSASRSYFTDIAGSPHEAAINAAAEAAFASGTAPGTYSPHGNVRRDQMASFLARTLNRLVERGYAEPPA